METYLNAFIRAAMEGLGFEGMSASTVKIIVDDLLKERKQIVRECADRAEAWYTQGVPESSRDEYSVEIVQLRAAIEGKEVQG